MQLNHPIKFIYASSVSYKSVTCSMRPRARTHTHTHKEPVSYTHLDVYKRQGYDRTIVSKLLHKTNNRQRQKTTNS